MRVWKRAFFACVLAAVFGGAGLSTPFPLNAQAVESESSAVHAYVVRTREVSTADYQIQRRPDQGTLHVYRITFGYGIEGIPPAERVLDVTVSASSGQVVGEYTVLSAD